MSQMVDQAGNIWEVDAQGNPVRFVGKVGGQASGPQPITLGTPNPIKRQRDRVDLDRATADLANTTATSDAMRRKAEADARKAELDALKAGKDSADGLDGQKIANLRALETLLNDLEKQYKRGPGATKNVAGLLDYLPTNENAQFDTAGAGIGDVGFAAFRVPGSGSQSDAELRAFVNANTPSASDRDTSIEQKIKNVRTRLNQTYQQYGIKPQPLDQGGEERGDLPSAIIGPDGVQRSDRVYANPTVGGGIATGTTAQGEAPPAELQSAMKAWVQANRGKMTPESYANAFDGFAQAFNYPGRANRANAARDVEQLNKGVPYGGVAPGVRQTTDAEQSKGAFLSSAPGAALASYLNSAGLGLPGAFSGGAMDAIRQESPTASIIGDIGGSITGTGVIANGLIKTGLAKDLPQALLRANLAYGTTRGASEMPENPFLGAGVGLALAGAGEGFGRFMVAPTVSAIARSRGGQALGNSVRGIFGRRQMPVTDKMSTGDQMIVSAVGDRGPETMSNLREAARLNLPFTLADANPNLRALAGSAVRKSPTVRQTAEDVLRPRAVGQIDRLQSAISRDFGDPTSVLTRSEELIKKARTDSGPLYDQAFSAPGASNVQLDDILNTPLGQEALRRARTQAMNDRVDPTSLGFDLSDQGEVILTRVPSFKTLDYVKRSFDDIANEGKTPFGTFQPNQSQATAANLAGELRTRVDNVNPVYGQARQAYAGPAGEREALNMGTRAPNQSADQVRYTLGNLGGNKPDQYRLGALSAISDQANRARFSSNPYEAIAGSPEARSRLGVLFPGGASNFTRQADLESEMSRTFTEALGGSQTAARGAADEAFDASPAVTLGIDAANAVATGSPPVATIARLGGNFLTDSYRLGLGQAKANEIGPVLLNPDAAQTAAIFREIRSNAIKSGLLATKAKKQGKIAGDLTATMAAPLTSYLLSQ